MNIEIEIDKELYDRFKKTLNINKLSYIKRTLSALGYRQEGLSEEDENIICKGKLAKLANELIEREINKHNSH